MGTTLIFPCTVPAAESYAETARQRGEPVVAASSVPYDTSATKFEKWFKLPSVHDADFLDCLQAAIEQFDIDRIYCPVLVAHITLTRLFNEGHLRVAIIGEMPIAGELRQHQKLMNAAATAGDIIQAIAGGLTDMTQIEIAAILRQALNIYGESYETKIAGLIAIFADAPRGDVIEIGTAAGRSATVLLLMARHYEIGPVLTVDPWDKAESHQEDSPPDVRNAGESWDMTALFETFVIGLLPLRGTNDFNYLPLPSHQAHAIWRDQKSVESAFFGAVSYCGSIAILHIDGNHDLERVRLDCELWLPHLAFGGWVVFDDYLWLHGAGPREVGNALLQDRAADVQRAFVCGGALFVKLGVSERL